MRIKTAYCSNTGRVREHNEDYLRSDDALGVVVLADGMGGYQAGEVASEIAVNTIMHQLAEPLKNLTSHRKEIANGYHRATILLEQAILKANQVVFDTAEQQVHYRGMGTTIVAAVFYNGWMSVAHVGDSRLYRLRNNQLQQLTKDHSVLQELIDCNFFTPEQARHSPNKNLVTRALGVGETINVDLKEYLVSERDIYLLCSDGLNDMLEDRDIQTILVANAHDLERCAQRLIEAANACGGEDNISALLARPVLPIMMKYPKKWYKKLLRC